jgi:hypothetical protein
MTLESVLSGCHQSLQYELTKHLLPGDKKDNTHTSGNVINGKHSTNSHVSFGVGHIQKENNSNYQT